MARPGATVISVVLVGFALTAGTIGVATFRGIDGSDSTAIGTAISDREDTETTVQPATSEGTPSAELGGETVDGDAQPSEDMTAEAATVAISEQIADEVPDPAAAPEPSATPEAPRFDLVRIDGKGRAVVAGHGPAESDVTLRLDGEKVGGGRADAAGNFVSLFDIGARAVPGILSIEIEDDAGTVIRGAEQIIVAPARAERGSEPADETGPEVAARSASSLDSAGIGVPAEEASPLDRAATAPDVVVSGAPQQAGTSLDQAPDGPEIRAATRRPIEPIADAPTDAALDRAPPTSLETDAPRLFRMGPEGLRILPEGGPDAVSAQGLGLDAITYDTEGDVQLAGRGQPDETIRIYLDNRELLTLVVDGAGLWATPLRDVDVGVYTLRIDALDADGDVRSRIETPFERTGADQAIRALSDGATAITVQPGFTLWAISEGYFGDGIRYVQIFEANRAQIRDPDLIFPGQVFTLPPGLTDE